MKTFTYDEIEIFLKKELNKSKHILTFGTIGSRNVENDLDVISTKKKDSKISDYYKELHNILEKLNDYLNKKHNSKLIRITRFDTEEEVKKIAKYKKNDFVLHLLTYVSLNQLENHWFSNLNSKNEIIDILKSYNCYIGSYEDIFSNKFKHEEVNEELFTYLNDIDRINSSYDEKILCRVLNNTFKFIYESRLFLKYNDKNTKNQIKKEFYNLCDKLEFDSEDREYGFLNEIEDYIRLKLGKTKSILGFFKIGYSNKLGYKENEEKITIIALKKKEYKTSQFYKELNNLFDDVNLYLKKTHKSKLVIFSRIEQQEEVKTIAKFKRGDLLFHFMSYVSLNQLLKHWSHLNFNKNEFLDNLYTIYGDKKSIFSDNFSKNYLGDEILLYLNDLNRINSNYEEKFLLKYMNSLFNYIMKKRMNIEPKIAQNKKEIKEIFYDICDKLDDRNK